MKERETEKIDKKYLNSTPAQCGISTKTRVFLTEIVNLLRRIFDNLVLYNLTKLIKRHDRSNGGDNKCI